MNFTADEAEFNRFKILTENRRQVFELRRKLVKLARYTTHKDGCEAGMWQQGEPTEDGGYRSMYAGKWYYGDDRPKCTCGLDELLEDILT